MQRYMGYLGSEGFRAIHPFSRERIGPYCSSLSEAFIGFHASLGECISFPYGEILGRGLTLRGSHWYMGMFEVRGT